MLRLMLIILLHKVLTICEEVLLRSLKAERVETHVSIDMPKTIVFKESTPD